MKASSKATAKSSYTLSSSDSDSDDNIETKLTEIPNPFGELSSSSSSEDHELLFSDDILFGQLKQKFSGGTGIDQPCTSTSRSKRPAKKPKIDKENGTKVPRQRKQASKNVTKTVTAINDADTQTTASVVGQNNASSKATKDPTICNKLEIDPRLLNLSFGPDLLANLQSNQIQYEIKDQPLSSCVFCPINIENDDDEFVSIKPLVLIIRTFTELASAIQRNNLEKHIVDMIPTSLYDCRITLIIFGTEDYLRHEKLNRSREMKRIVQTSNASQQSDKRPLDDNISSICLNRVQIESALARLQFSGRLQYLTAEKSDEVAQMIVRFAKGLRELPNKLRINKNRERVNWFAEADGKNPVPVDANGNGLSRLWQQQIMQFPNVGLDPAGAIISVYSSPKALVHAYDQCSSVQEAESLLQDIPIRRQQGPLSNVRRIGPELSKKICAFFKDHPTS